MLLEGKVALVHAAGGQVGRRVAEQFAREGAYVWLAGRDTTKLEPLADAVRRRGGNVEVVAIDALDAQSIERSTARIMSAAGRLDIEFNAIAVGSASAIIGPATDIAPDTFLESFRTVVLSQFLTARAAARHMLSVGQGSIILLTATPGRGVAPLMAGHSASHAAIEGLVKSLAAEWGSSGVRVTGLMSGGMPETNRIGEVLATMAKFTGVGAAEMARMTLQRTQLKRAPTLDQTARVAAFLASDYAGSLTGTIVNGSCGEVVG
jgi:NAD(P)-dependent dehydrogenase (short-subunit alcohol dehydrogenase family)